MIIFIHIHNISYYPYAKHNSVFYSKSTENSLIPTKFDFWPNYLPFVRSAWSAAVGRQKFCQPSLILSLEYHSSSCSRSAQLTESNNSNMSNVYLVYHFKVYSLETNIIVKRQSILWTPSYTCKQINKIKYRIIRTYFFLFPN